jgi:hypothetical protein
MNKTIFTRVFLKQLGKSTAEVSVKEHMPLWWQNTRQKDTGGLRLTEEGFEIIKKLEITFYEILLPQDMPLTTQVIIFLDKFIDCPYFVTNKYLYVTNEKKAVELSLFSGDVRRYGLNKALKKSQEDEDSG